MFSSKREQGLVRLFKSKSTTRSKLIAAAAISLISIAACCLLAVGRSPAKQTTTESSRQSNQQIMENYGKIPLAFEANEGQTDNQVKFLSRGNGYGLYLTAEEAVLVLRKSDNPQSEGPQSAALRMKLLGANSSPQVSGLEKTASKSNYFIGNDPKKWRTNVANYAKVKYEEVYRGVDLVYYGNQRELEYDFVVKPGADPQAVRLGFQGTDGLEVESGGDLLLKTAAGEIRQRKPLIYQEAEGIRQEIAGAYVLKGEQEVGFEVAAYDAGKPLIIDPVVLAYSTYLDGSGNDFGFGIAVDSLGNAYVTGATISADFPTTPGAFQTAFGIGDAFVTKLNPAGSALVYSTFLGGGDSELGNGIAVDSSGNAYATGFTDSFDFPTTPGAFQTDRGGRDAFVARINEPTDPVALINALVALVESFNLKQGIENSLDSKLQNALNALNAINNGDRPTACNAINAFINEVNAQSGKTLTTAQANQLIAAAQLIKTTLGCQ